MKKQMKMVVGGWCLVVGAWCLALGASDAMADRIPQEFGESSSCVELVYADGSVELFSSRDEAVDFGAADADGVLPRVLTASKTGEQGFYRVIVR